MQNKKIILLITLFACSFSYAHDATNQSHQFRQFRQFFQALKNADKEGIQKMQQNFGPSFSLGYTSDTPLMLAIKEVGHEAHGSLYSWYNFPKLMSSVGMVYFCMILFQQLVQPTGKSEELIENGINAALLCGGGVVLDNLAHLARLYRIQQRIEVVREMLFFPGVDLYATNDSGQTALDIVHYFIIDGMNTDNQVLIQAMQEIEAMLLNNKSNAADSRVRAL